MSKNIILHNQLLGDTLFNLPAFKAYKEKLTPEDQLILVVQEKDEWNHIFDGNPLFTKVLHVEEPVMNTLITKYGSSRGNLKEFKTKAGEKEYALITDAGIAFQWCIKHPKLVNKLTNGFNKPIVETPHFAFGFSQQLRVDITNSSYTVYLEQQEIDAAKEYLGINYSKPQFFVGALSKSCTSRSTKPEEKGWPPNKMVLAEVWQPVIDKFYKDYDFVFLASGNEALLPLNNVHWMEGKSIRFVASAIKNSALFVGIDSGPLNLAQAVDAKCVGIYAAVPSTLVSNFQYLDHSYMIDHSQSNPSSAQGIASVTSEEIIVAIETLLNKGE